MAFGTETHGAGTGTSVAISKPASTANGDTLLYAISVDSNTATVTFPTGFAHVTGSPITVGTPDGHRLHVGWKVSDGSDGATLTATISASNGWSAAILRYTGRHATTPVEVAPGTGTNGTGNSSPVAPSASSITTSTNGCDLVWIAALDNTTSTPGAAATAPSGYTERVDTTDTNATNITAADINQATAGATGAVAGSISFSAGTSGWLAFLVPLAPGAASPATLSAPTPSGTLGTSTTATLGATTDTTSGTLYTVVDDTAALLVAITAAQIKAGQNNVGGAADASSNSAVSTTTPSTGVTGLTANTAYSYATVQNSAGGDSNIVTGTFTTAAAVTGSNRLMLLGVG